MDEKENKQNQEPLSAKERLKKEIDDMSDEDVEALLKEIDGDEEETTENALSEKKESESVEEAEDAKSESDDAASEDGNNEAENTSSEAETSNEVPNEGQQEELVENEASVQNNEETSTPQSISVEQFNAVSEQVANLNQRIETILSKLESGSFGAAPKPQEKENSKIGRFEELYRKNAGYV